MYNIENILRTLFSDEKKKHFHHIFFIQWFLDVQYLESNLQIKQIVC